MGVSPSGRHLVIRTAQLEAFAAEAVERLVDKGVELVRKSWPAVAQRLGDDTRRFVAGVVARGDRYGLHLEGQALRLVNCTCALGEGFEESDRFPWAQELLQDEALTPGQRLDALEAQVKRELKSRKESSP